MRSIERLGLVMIMMLVVSAANWFAVGTGFVMAQGRPVEPQEPSERPVQAEAEAEAMARLELDTTVVDLGVLSVDSIVEATVGFRNAGEAPLVLLSIFSDCGCTSTSHTKEPVAPGERGEIRVRFNPHGRRPGEFRKTLRIRSNASNPREHLFVKGSVGAK